MIKITEIRNPAAVGFRWVSDGYSHEITWIRGSARLLFGTMGVDDRWHSINIDNPERFGGFDGTLTGARKAARAFVDECEGRSES